MYDIVGGKNLNPDGPSRDSFQISEFGSAAGQAALSDWQLEHRPGSTQAPPLNANLQVRYHALLGPKQGPI